MEIVPSKGGVAGDVEEKTGKEDGGNRRDKEGFQKLTGFIITDDGQTSNHLFIISGLRLLFLSGLIKTWVLIKYIV